MLNETQHIGHRIKLAMEAKGVGPTEVGKAFGVKPPSVNDWVSSGRIAKKHLSKLVSYFDQPLEWWIDGNKPTIKREPVHKVSEPEPQSLVPDRLITIADITSIWAQLSPERQRRLIATAHDFLCAQQSEKPHNGNPYGHVAAPPNPNHGPSRKITKDKT